MVSLIVFAVERLSLCSSYLGVIFLGGVFSSLGSGIVWSM